MRKSDRIWRWLVPAAAGLAGAVAWAAEPLSSEETARLGELDAKGFQTFTNVDLSEYLALREKVLAATDSSPKPANRLAHFALKALDEPFRLNAGRFDYGEVDCVVFCERCLAMALSKDWQSYRRISDRLRHKDGVVDYRNRNFSTLGDWLPNNVAWLLEDITPTLPGAETFTHIVRPKRFRDVTTAEGTKPVFLGHDWKSKNTEERKESYIPRKAVPGVLKDLRTGDVVLVIYGIGKRAGCDHMGLIVLNDDEDVRVTIVHAAKPRVRQDPLTQFLDSFPRVSGFKFLRVRADAAESVAKVAADAKLSVPDPACQDEEVTQARTKRGDAASNR